MSMVREGTGGQLSNLKVSWVTLEDNMSMVIEGLKDNYQTCRRPG